VVQDMATVNGQCYKGCLPCQRLAASRVASRMMERRAGEQPPVVAEMMSMSDVPSGSTGEQTIPEEIAIEIRRLTHDLSNALEIIVQTSYLLGTTELKAPGSDWLRMLDGGVRKALDLNGALRTYVREHSAR